MVIPKFRGSFPIVLDRVLALQSPFAYLCSRARISRPESPGSQPETSRRHPLCLLFQLPADRGIRG
jgi:hypothetical protein